VVNLPSLENSGETTAALGKIVVASLRNMMAQTLGVNLEGDFEEIVANKPSLAPTPFPVVFDEIGYYAVAGMDKMLAMGRGLGFMFYLGFQELPGLKARIGESVYSLLGNANLQILMKLQEGSETRQYVERTAGESEVTQQTSYTATGSGGYRDAQHAEVRRVSRVDWKDLRGLIEGEAIVLFGNRRVHAKLFYANINPRGRLRLNRPLVLGPPAVGAVERAAARTATIRRLIESGGPQAPSQVDTGPVLAAVLEGFRRGRAERKSVADCVAAAIAAAGKQTPAPTPVTPPPTLPTPPLAPGQPVPDAPATDYDPMLEAGVSMAPMGKAAAAPVLPTGAADMDVLALLTLVEEHAGRSKAEARVGAMRVLAERDAAVAEQWTELPPMAPGAFAQLVEAVIADVLPPEAQKDVAA